MPMLQVRRLADKSEGVRKTMYDPDTGAPRLVNPATPGTEHEPWPTAGWDIIGDAPEETAVGMHKLREWQQAGFVTTQGDRVVHQPGGPPDDPWRVTHTFHECDVVTFNCVGGQVEYEVTSNPGKDVDGDGQVDWVYSLALLEDDREDEGNG